MSRKVKFGSKELFCLFWQKKNVRKTKINLKKKVGNLKLWGWSCKRTWMTVNRQQTAAAKVEGVECEIHNQIFRILKPTIKYKNIKIKEILNKRKFQWEKHQTYKS